MAGSGKQHRLEDHLGKASDALVKGKVFEAERLAERALAAARQERDFTRMSAIVDLLLQARKARMELALAVNRITIINEPVGENIKVKPGCYLIQPPQVASDARRLRLAALATDVPALVLCREPLTQTKLVPVVAISPGITIRTKVPPPQDSAKPDVDWLLAAVEDLGNWAIDTIDAALPAGRRMEVLLDCLDALPEHENLHRALQQACEACALEASAAPAKQPRTKIKTA